MESLDVRRLADSANDCFIIVHWRPVRGRIRMKLKFVSVDWESRPVSFLATHYLDLNLSHLNCIRVRMDSNPIKEISLRLRYTVYKCPIRVC
jgi:hypothetical protein